MSKLLKRNNYHKKTDDNPSLDLGFDSLQSTCPSPENTDCKYYFTKSDEPFKLGIIESIMNFHINPLTCLLEQM